MSVVALVPITLIIILILIFLKTKNTEELYIYILAYSCIVDIVFDRAAFTFGSVEVNCGLIIRFCLIVIGICYLNKKKWVKYSEAQVWGILLLISLFLGMVYGLIVPYDGSVVEDWDDYIVGKEYPHHKEFNLYESVKIYFSIIIYILNAYIIKYFLTKNVFVNLMRKIFKGCLILVCFGYIELFFKKILLYPNVILDFIDFAFGDVSTSYNSAGVEKNGVYLLQGFQAEPSQFVLHLFTIALLGIIINEITYKDINKIDKFALINVCLIFLLMLLSGGFSALLCCGLIILFGIAIHGRWYNMSFKSFLKSCLALFIVALIGTGVIYNLLNDAESYWGERIRLTLTVIEYMFTPGGLAMLNYADSSLARFISIVQVFENFLDRPLLGLGVGYLFAHDSLVSFLADFGVVGTFLWYKFIICKDQYNNKYDMVFFVLYFLVAGLPEGDARSYAGRVYVFLLFESTKFYCNEIYNVRGVL